MKNARIPARCARALALALALVFPAACANTVGISYETDASTDARAADSGPARDAVTPRVDGATSPPDVLGSDALEPDVVVAPDVVETPDVVTPTGPLARVPERPTDLRNVPGTQQLVFVTRRLHFGFESRALWGTHGFDRDGLATDPNVPGRAGGSCRPRGTTQPPEDGFEGRDNAFAPRLGGTFVGAGFTETGINDKITNGTEAIAFRVTDYGATDDLRVLVEWLPVIHGHRPGDAVSRPLFDGTDVWHINRRVAYDPSAPTLARVRAPAAFVSGGTLVMDLPSRAPLRLLGARNAMRLTLSAGKIVGPLTRLSSGPYVLGPLEVSAVWPLADALNDLTTLGVCPLDTLTYAVVTRALQGAADLLGTLEYGPMIECDAVSVGFGLEFTTATLGPDEEDTASDEDLCSGP